MNWKIVLAKLLFKLITSDFAKAMIEAGFNKLIGHKTDGVTPDIAQVALDSIGKSLSNKLSTDATDKIKTLL